MAVSKISSPISWNYIGQINYQAGASNQFLYTLPTQYSEYLIFVYIKKNTTEIRESVNAPKSMLSSGKTVLRVGDIASTGAQILIEDGILMNMWAFLNTEEVSANSEVHIYAR